jgi:hypothetical protein
MRYILTVLVLLCVSSCTQNQREPEQLIPPAQMEQILWDYIKADVYAVEFFKKFNAAANDTLFNLKMQKTIFDHYKVRPQNFFRSYRYYCTHPEKMSVILDSIEARQNREKRILEINFNKDRI